ncbi:MAG: hypothetical protein SFU98_19135 [Leptospiraceae bacterium]|nr:hypothetical protein [Leptospiraceae bacterium]
MLSTVFFCPFCNQKIKPTNTNVSYSLPPTGGDYEWVETEKNETCICNQKFLIKVRVDLESQKITKLISIPKPKSPEIIWYSISEITKISGDQVVYSKEIFNSLDELNHAKTRYPEKYLVALKITQDGYFLEEELIVEPKYYHDVILFSIY